MSRLIVVCGLPGSGKTTLAGHLSTALGLACLHKDAIKENLYELLGMSTLEESKSVGACSVKLLLRIAEDILKKNADIIIEGPFNFEDDPELFRAWTDKYAVEPYFVVCEIDEETRRKRFVDRPRHQAHHDQERLLADKDEDWSYRKQFDYSRMPGTVVRVRTDRPVDELAEVLLALLPR